MWRVDPSVRFYVVTCHPSATDTVVSEYIGKLISHPAIFDLQDKAIQRKIEGRKSAREHDFQSQPEPDLGETVDGIFNMISIYNYFET